MFFSEEQYLFGCKIYNWENGGGEITTEKGRPYLKKDGAHYKARPRKRKKNETEANTGFQYEIKVVL